MIKRNQSKKTSSDNIKWCFKEPKKIFAWHWYLKMVIVFAILIGLALFLIKSISTAFLFGIIMLALFIYTKKPSEKINFMIDEEDIYIEEKIFKIKNFKSFCIKPSQSFYSIAFTPNKRLGSELIIYFEEKDGEKIVDFLSNFLPMEDYKPSIVDQIVEKIGL